MIAISIDGDVRIINGLEKAIAAAGSPKRAMEDIGEVLVKEIDRNFETEGQRLTGQKWHPLAERTIKDRKRRGYGAGPILQRSGALRGSFSMHASDFQVRVSSDSDYGGHHQVGGANLPQRKIIHFSELLKQEIMAQFTRFIANALRGANR